MHWKVANGPKIHSRKGDCGMEWRDDPIPGCISILLVSIAMYKLKG